MCKILLTKGNRKNGVGSSPVLVLIGGNSPNLDHGKINGSNMLKDSSHEKCISSDKESSSRSEPLIAVLDGLDFNYLLHKKNTWTWEVPLSAKIMPFQPRG